MDALTKLRQRQKEIEARLQEIEAEADGARFSDSQKDEWNSLNTELDGNRDHIAELETRQERLEELARRNSVEAEPKPSEYRRGVPKLVPDDPTDLVAYRAFARDVDQLNDGYLEGALRLAERMVPANPQADREASQERIEHLLRYVDHPQERALARRIIATSSETYNRAFGKYLKGQHRTPEEERALSLTVGEGGYAVPYTLDPTVILVSAGVVNPVRQFARVVTITGNTWYGVSSTGITASYGAEATEADDNAPSLVQPSATVEKAQAFIPFSIEIGQDWGALQSEMARLFSDAKNTLESSKFHAGLGSGSNEPQGLLVGATAVITSASTAVLAAGDIYSLELALSPRFRDGARFVGNKGAFHKIRQFDTQGGANLWVQLAFDQPGTLIGYPASEWSAYSSALTTSGSTVLTFGDFSYFRIIDRVGMDVELIPHLFSTANNRPTGQRGLYCYWRNTSAVVTPGLQANSAFVSLKLL